MSDSIDFFVTGLYFTPQITTIVCKAINRTIKLPKLKINFV